MIDKNFKYIELPPTRDIVFVLGAGASEPDGVPLSRDILPIILDGSIEEITNSEIGKNVIDFIKSNFHIVNDQLNPTLEAVFGFIDYFLLQKESLSSYYTTSQISIIKENLIKLIHYVINHRADRSSPFYHKFWKLIDEHNQNVSIITLNYDTLLEEAFKFLFHKRNYIDYCLQLMNYSKTTKSKEFDFWINPREPVECEKDENPSMYKIIKLHGSLNWKYCNCCNQTLLTPWDKTIDLSKGKFLGYTYPDKKEYQYYCPNDNTDFETLILPPSHIKTLSQPVISNLFSEASRELMTAKRIVFIGYSLSYSDVHIKALLKKHIKNDIDVYVINRHNNKSLKNRYLSLSDKIRFIDCSFEELMKDEKLQKLIFA